MPNNIISTGTLKYEERRIMSNKSEISNTRQQIQTLEKYNGKQNSPNRRQKYKRKGMRSKSKNWKQ